ncbi:MAG TPA: nucleotidyl transferase AbiEii/AbiGii toxin family protein [bacterium]|nr:nucleotidyl transferase AbiEii/AbiGii toxin family protein [bacterium]
MKLHTNKDLFSQAVRFTAQQMGIPDIYVEKDYWVTYALYTLFHNPIGSETVFKGGTALSKCFGLIGRFSEDIDLVVIRGDSESGSSLTKKIRKISEVISSVLPEIEIEGLTQKKGMIRKTVHTYKKEFQGKYGQVRDVIVIEATWFGYFEPYVEVESSSFIYEMMFRADRLDMTAEYGLEPFKVLALKPERTLCEKIMSLVRFSYSENPVENLKKKIRHTYDLHQMLKKKEIEDFFESENFDRMLLKVANSDISNYKNNNNWLKNHPSGAVVFSECEKVWEELKPVYKEDFRNLVFGDFPDERAIFETLVRIRNRLSRVIWNIDIV